MTKKAVNRIKEIWEQIESNPSVTEGIAKVRFSQTSPCDLYLGIKTPENARVLAISVSVKNGRAIDSIRNIKGLRIEKVLNSNKEGYLLLNLVLSDDHFHDIFDVLINDIILNVVDLSDEKEIIKTFYSRLEKWQTLFEKYNPEGLTAEYQRGLYGELNLLRKMLVQNSSQFRMVQGWVGSANAVQDFQMGSSAIEVKISSGNNHKKIHISNERQLDESLVENLFLFHISLDVRSGHGETLNEIVNEIRNTLIQDAAAYSLFNHKLIEAGYFDIHKEVYSETGYTIRGTNYYKICNEFPRLKEKDIPDGVGDVKYTVNISDCNDYSVSESDLFKLIL